MALGIRGMTVEAGHQYEYDREEWRALVHMKMIECNMPFLLGFCVLFVLPSCALVACHLERSGMPLHDEGVVNCKEIAKW